MKNLRPLRSKKYAGTGHLMNPDRPYTHSSQTDINVTFARERMRLLNEQIAKAKQTGAAITVLRRRQ